VPYEQLPDLYSSAAIVLNDHWDDMREHGFVSNRVFDALACGAFVLSDENAGLAEAVGEGVETFSDVDDLRAKLGLYLEDPRLRREVAERGRRAVLARHTADHRAEQLLELLAEVRSRA
jgi:spore maturation protein CgeB